MAYTEQQIINDFISLMTQEGSGYRYWYVGISKDAEDRLFNGHGVDQKDDWWIYRQAFSSRSARNVENHFLALGCDGGSGGGDQDADYVYAYRKTRDTNP